jgi:hypothetical protein
MISNDSDKNNIQYLISQCVVAVANENLLIHCPNDEIWRELVKNYKDILKFVPCKKDANCITIATKERRVSFPLNPSYRLHLPNMNIIQEVKTDLRSRIPSEREEDIIAEVLGYEGAAYIIRVSDDNGLLSNSRIQQSSGTNPNDWVGKRISNYWIEEELLRYKQTLMREVSLSNFSYVAYLFTGEAARFTVDARLTYYRGDLVRLVKSLACEPIS